MSKRFILIIPILLITCSLSFAQKTDSLAKKLDSMQKKEAKTPEKPEINTNKVDYTARTNLTVKSYFVLLGTDMVQEVTGPFHSTSRSWKKVGVFVAIEGALFFADKPIQRSSQTFMNNNPGMQNISLYITNFGGAWEGYTLAAFGAYGFIFKSNKVKTTTFLATQSYIAAGAMSSLVKFVTGRVRPNGFTADEQESNTIFKGPSSTSLGRSFPSGHSTAVFAAATVFAQEYKDEILIPVIAYSAATLVCMSRVTQNAHWATDVLAGAGLGYVTGLQVVRNYHRYAKLQNGKQKTSLLFYMNYQDGILMPSMIYRF